MASTFPVPEPLKGCAAPIDIAAIKVEDGLAALRGVDLKGRSIGGEAAAENLERFGADSLYTRYCLMVPLITLQDLARDWGIDIGVVRAWALLGEWETARRAYLQTVPIELGGYKAVGDLAVTKQQFITDCLANIAEAMAITMERIRARSEEQIGKLSVEELKKTSRSHFDDVSSMTMLQNQGRTALGMPTRLGETKSQSESVSRRVVESIVRAPMRAGMLHEALPHSAQPAELEGVTVTTTRTDTLTLEAD